MAAASAGAFNCVYDRDIDRLMTRTQARPVAAGRISPRRALVFAMDQSANRQALPAQQFDNRAANRAYASGGAGDKDRFGHFLRPSHNLSIVCNALSRVGPMISASCAIIRQALAAFARLSSLIEELPAGRA